MKKPTWVFHKLISVRAFLDQVGSLPIVVVAGGEDHPITRDELKASLLQVFDLDQEAMMEPLIVNRGGQRVVMIPARLREPGE